MRVNIGGGRKFKRAGWENLDISANATIPFDLLRLGVGEQLPIPTGACEAVYSSHTIEHLATATGLLLLDEIRRITAPGGVARLTCPDFGLALGAYLSGNKAFFERSWVPEFRAYSIEQAFLATFCAVRSEWCTRFLREPDYGYLLSDVEVRRRNWSLRVAEIVCLEVDEIGCWPNHRSPWTVRKIQEHAPGWQSVSPGLSRWPEFNHPPFDTTVPAASLFVELRP